MSVAPIRFPGREKEPPFDVATLRRIISELLLHTADEVESEQIEIKGWCNNDRELADKVAEACACLANTSGGFVLIGVADGVNPGQNFSSCPYPEVGTSWLQTNVYNRTRPPVECFPFDASVLLAEVVGCPTGNLYALRVPRTRYISGHLTQKGISKIRVGKECQPQYLAEDDRTSVTVPQISMDDLSASSVDWGIAQHQKHFKTSAAWAERTDFLAQARLLQTHLPDEEYLPEFHPSLAALLLFGKVAAIERNVSFFETVVMMDGGRILIRKNVIESVRDLCIGETSILRSRLPQIPAEVLKELVVNAYIHRCYRTPAPIIVSVSDTDLEIRSPGELLTGLSVCNLIHGVPVYRNLLLADGARFVGLCDKIGQGIDLVFKGVLSGGLGFPEFESGNNLFTARIPLAGNGEFKEFLRRRSQALNRLDEIIILRMLWGKEPATAEELCSRMQRKRDFADRVLSEMAEKGMIEVAQNSFRLAHVLRRDIETIFQSDQLPLSLSMWGSLDE
jgi:ATP-dependent DNA helicase RecG